MLPFILRKAVHMAVVLLAVSVLVFIIFIKLPGGSPEARLAGKNASPELISAIRHDFGFDRSAPSQYGQLMGQLASGDLTSFTTGQNVREELLRRLPVTASMVIGAAILWLGFGIAFGVLSAMYAGRWPDRLLTILALVGVSLPVFWVGLVLLYYLTYKVRLFPPGGYVPPGESLVQWIYHLVLPCTTLAVLFIGFYTRLLRANILDTREEDYVRTAKAKGLGRRRVMIRHVLRNALIPVITLFGLDFGAAFGGGAILTESVFNIPGVGQYAAQSIGALDIPPIMGTVLYSAFFIVLLSVIVDVAYARLDPRIRLR